jgi:magnesium transporter
MLRCFLSDDDDIREIEGPIKGCWIALSEPSDSELAFVSQKYDIDLADMRASLDEEERSRVDVEEKYTMVIVDIPTVENRDGRDWYETIPLSVIVTNDVVITVCEKDTPLLRPFMQGRIRNFYTYMKSRFILQILYRNSQMYLRYLRIVDRESDKLELRLQHSMQNREILMLMELSKTLVYFATSLRSNEVVLERLTKLPRIKQYPDDEDLLNDVIIENKQAIEMAGIYSGVLQGMMDAFGSIVSNNLNNVMRIFSILSIVLSIPTIIFSAYGMNLNLRGMPLSHSVWGFLIICVFSIIIAVIAWFWLSKSKLFR